LYKSIKLSIFNYLKKYCGKDTKNAEKKVQFFDFLLKKKCNLFFYFNSPYFPVRIPIFKTFAGLPATMVFVFPLRLCPFATFALIRKSASAQLNFNAKNAKDTRRKGFIKLRFVTLIKNPYPITPKISCLVLSV